MRWWMEMQEKRFDLEKEHFKTMEGLFSNLISVSFNSKILISSTKMNIFDCFL